MNKVIFLIILLFAFTFTGYFLIPYRTITNLKQIYQTVSIEEKKQPQQTEKQQENPDNTLESYWDAQQSTKIESSATPVTSNKEAEEPAETLLETFKNNSTTFSLWEYPFSQSPLYVQHPTKCYYAYQSDVKDLKLIKNQSEVLIPSLMDLVASLDYEQMFDRGCSMPVDIFSIPSSGKYIYLHTYLVQGTDAPSSGISGIYRLNLSNLTIKRLSVSDFLSRYDLYRGSAFESIKILPDGKKLIKWNMNGLFLVNLESDSTSNFYTAADNEWLISKIDFGMGQGAKYEVKINESKVTIGIYDKTKTQEGYPIRIDENGNVRVDSSDWKWWDDIQPKFIKTVTLDIPS